MREGKREKWGMSGSNDRAARWKCVCVHMCLLALAEKEADSEGLLSLQVLAIGHRNHSEISLLLLLTNGLRSLIWLAQDQKQMAYSLRGLVAAPGGWRGGSGGLWPRLPLSLTVPVFVCVHICARGSCVCRCVSASSAPRSCVRVRDRERKMHALIWTMASLLFRHVSGDSTDMSGRGQMSEMWLLWMPPLKKV